MIAPANLAAPPHDKHWTLAPPAHAELCEHRHVKRLCQEGCAAPDGSAGGKPASRPTTGDPYLIADGLVSEIALRKTTPIPSNLSTSPLTLAPSPQASYPKP